MEQWLHCCVVSVNDNVKMSFLEVRILALKKLKNFVSFNWNEGLYLRIGELAKVWVLLKSVPVIVLANALGTILGFDYTLLWTSELFDLNESINGNVSDGIESAFFIMTHHNLGNYGFVVSLLQIEKIAVCINIVSELILFGTFRVVHLIVGMFSIFTPVIDNSCEHLGMLRHAYVICPHLCSSQNEVLLNLPTLGQILNGYDSSKLSFDYSKHNWVTMMKIMIVDLSKYMVGEMNLKHNEFVDVCQGMWLTKTFEHETECWLFRHGELYTGCCQGVC